MALTSPDNIYSPNIDDNWAVPQAMGAMADSVQAALKRRANSYLGSSAEREASTNLPEGSEWRDTDGVKGSYILVNGVWKPQVFNAGRYEVMGSIRRANGGGSGPWGVLSDSGHTPIGIQDVTPLSTSLRINYNFQASSVIGWSMALGNSYARSPSGLRIGWSIGTSYAEAFFYPDSSGTTPVDPMLISVAGGFWVSGQFRA